MPLLRLQINTLNKCFILNKTIKAFIDPLMKIENFLSFKFLAVFLSLLISFIFLLSQVSCCWNLQMADGTAVTLSEETGESETTAETTIKVPEPEQTLIALALYRRQSLSSST